MTLDATTIMAVSTAVVAIIGAIAAGVVTVMNGLSKLRDERVASDANMTQKMDTIHAAVNGQTDTLAAIKEQGK